MSVEIHEASAQDCKSICEFNCALALETEGTRLNPERVIRGVESLLADPSKGRYWLLKYHAQTVGQIMVTYEWSDWSNANYWWLGSIYIAEQYRGRGLLRKLFTHVEQLARTEGAAALRLYVEQSNSRAKTAYRNLGMHDSHYQIMALDFGA